VSAAYPIISSVQESLKDKEGHAAIEVSSSFVRAYEAERIKRATETILGIYGLDMPTFLANGSAMFDSAIGVMRERIEQVRLGIDFLVCGFDPNDKPHIVTISEPNVFTGTHGYVNHYDQPGYWAIGSGERNALTRLAARGQHFLKPLHETIYNVIEAKVAAESAHGVGEETFLAVHQSSKSEGEKQACFLEATRWLLSVRRRGGL
jgi:hypothetical protein